MRDGHMLHGCASALSEIFQASRVLLCVAVLAGFVAGPARAADTADEARAINRQVLDLFRAAKFGEAYVLAEKGLALCEDAGSVKVDCTIRFNEILGDISLSLLRYPTALAHYDRALRVGESEPGRGQLLVPRLQLRIGRVQIALHHGAEAEAALKRAIAGFEQQAPNNRELGSALTYLRQIYSNAGRFEEAISVARRAIDVVSAIDGANNRTVLILRLNLGTDLQSLGKIDEAEALARETLDQANTLPPADPVRGWSARRMAQIKIDRQDHVEAERLAKIAVAFEEMQASVDNRNLLIALEILQRVYLGQGQYENLRATARRAHSIAGRTFGPTSAEAAKPLILEAFSYKQQRQFAEAERILQRALTEIPGLGQSQLGLEARTTLGEALFGLGRYADAEAQLDQALVAANGARPRNDFVGRINLALGDVHRATQRPKQAVAHFQKAFEVLVAWRGDATLFVVDAEDRLTNALIDARDLDRAGPHIEHALAFAERLGSSPVWVARIKKTIGRLFFNRKENAKAERALREAIRLIDLSPAGGESIVKESLVHLSAVYESFRNDDEKFSEAEQGFQYLLAFEQKPAYRDSALRSSIFAGLAMTYRDLARHDEAERLLLESVKLEEAAGQERKPYLAARLSALATVLRRECRYSDAENALVRALEIEQSELGRAMALNSLGLIYTATDRYEKAEPLFKEALAIREKGLPADDTLTLETLTNLASIDSWMARYSEAETKLRDALRRAESHGPSHSIVIALQSAFLANALIPVRKLDEAEALARRAIDLNQQRLGAEHRRTVGALKTLASIELARGRDREAEVHFRRALAIDEKISGAQSPAVAYDLLDLASLRRNSGKWQDAKANIDRALRIVTAQFGADSPSCVGAILAAANMAYETGQYGEARRLANRARDIQEINLGHDHPAIPAIWILSVRIDIAQGRLDDAHAKLDRAADVIARALPPGHPVNIDLLGARADLAWAHGKHTDREQFDRQALVVAEELFGLDHPTYARAFDRLAGTLWAQGKFAEVERLRRDRLAKIERDLGLDHRSTAGAARALANVLANTARLNDAVALYQRTLAIDEQAFGPESREAASAHLSLGAIFRRLGRYEQARIETNRARKASEGQGNLLAIGSSLEQLAQLAADEGEFAEGLILVERAVAVAEQELGSDSPALAEALMRLGRYYLQTDQKDVAARTLRRIEGLIGETPPEQAPAYWNLLLFRSQIIAEQGDIAGADALLERAIVWATKYAGPQASTVAIGEFNRAVMHLKAGHFKQALPGFTKAIEIFKRESGDRAPLVGYGLLGAARAYEGIGDRISSAALFTLALDILGPTIAAQRPEPKWL
jgi:tetratricopeptide (TPR) repeat protein